MPKRSNRNKRADLNLLAKMITDEAVGDVPKVQDDGKNPAAVVLGRLGGLKGGKARAEKLTKEERLDIAKKAAKARWKKVDEEAKDY